MRFAKATGSAVVIVGHVTKEGAIAGPRVLEHLVDTVLYFESEAGSRFRIVRATKNRFGAVNELGFFAMTGTGLEEVRNPAAIFLARAPEPAAGSIVTVTREGGRPLLIELQALVDRMRFGAPRRIAQGLDANRLAMLLAVVNRHAGVSLQEHDVFVNVVGGIEIGETAWDLPVVMALASSLADRVVPAVAGGLRGDRSDRRGAPGGLWRRAAARGAAQGFKVASCRARMRRAARRRGLSVVPVGRISEALEAALGSRQGTALRRLGRLRCTHAHRANGVVRDLQHLELVVPDAHHRAGAGDGLQLLEQQAVDRLRAVGGQLPSQRAVQRADRGAGIDDEHPGALDVHVLVRDGRRIGGELPDDLLEDVLQRHQPLDVAVLVDHEGEAAAVALEVRQLQVQGVPSGTK